MLAGVARGKTGSEGGGGPVRLSDVDTFTSSFPLAAPTNIKVSLPLQLMKAAVPAESYTFYLLSSRSAYSGDVFCQ